MWPIPGHSEVVALQPLTFFYGNDPRSLGLGLPGSFEIASNFNDPLSLTTDRSEIGLNYQFENILRDKNTKLASHQLAVTGVLNFNLPHTGATTAGLHLGNIESDYRTSNPDEYAVTQGTAEQTVSVAMRPHAFLSVGAGIEHVDSNSNVFFAVETRVPGWLKLKYREFQQHVELLAAVIADNKEGRFRIKTDDNVRELTVTAEVKSYLALTLATALNRDHNRTADLNIAPAEKVKVAYRYAEHQYSFRDSITFDGSPQGRISSTAASAEHTLLLHYQYTAAIVLVSAAKQGRYRFDASGQANGTPLFDFWNSLVIGERKFSANYELETTQYALGMEVRRTPAVTLRGGLQYIRLNTRGEFGHWIPIPILGFGKFDAQTIPLPYTGATFMGLAFGVSYQVGAVDVSYALSQIIPLSKRKVTDGQTTEDKPKVDTGNASDSVSNGIKNNPGGNLHLLRLTWKL